MKKLLLACCVIMALAWATNVMAQDANYTVKPGDLLSISVWKEPDLQKETLVRPDGSFSFPLVEPYCWPGPLRSSTGFDLRVSARDRMFMY